jgi:hypothetical protein
MLADPPHPGEVKELLHFRKIVAHLCYRHSGAAIALADFGVAAIGT